MAEKRSPLIRFTGMHPSQIKQMLADRVARFGNTCHNPGGAGGGQFCGGEDSRSGRLNEHQKKIYNASNESGKKAYLDMLERKGQLTPAAPVTAPRKSVAVAKPSAAEKAPVSPGRKPLISTSGRSIAPQTSNPNPDSPELTAVKKNITKKRGENQPGYKFIDVNPLGNEAPTVDDRSSYVRNVSELSISQLVSSAKGNIITKANGDIVSPRPASSHLREKLETFGIADEMLNKGSDGKSKLEHMLAEDKPVHEEIRSDATGGDGTSLIYYRPEHPGYVYNVTIRKNNRTGNIEIATLHVEKLFNESPTNVQESLALTGHSDDVNITKSWTYLRDRYIADGLSSTEATAKAKDKFKRF